MNDYDLTIVNPQLAIIRVNNDIVKDKTKTSLTKLADRLPPNIPLIVFINNSDYSDFEELKKSNIIISAQIFNFFKKHNINIPTLILPKEIEVKYIYLDDIKF